MNWVISVSHSRTCTPLPLITPLSTLNPSRELVPKSTIGTCNGRSSRCVKADAAEIEIRVCTNRTCRRQGSVQIRETLSDIAPPNVSVNSCGCLGRCGAGPNLVALPAAVMVNHCGTAARAADFMVVACGGRNAGDGDRSEAWKCLEALALRKRAEVKLGIGNFSEAEFLLSKAIDLKPFGGIHVTYKDRSCVRFRQGDLYGALEDAKQALMLAPQYAQAYICQGDAFFAMDLFDKAEDSYSLAIETDPSVHHSKSFQARIAKLQEKLTSVTAP
ncbi:hypothetical protein Nepgr_015967 [Nepenthes gracilis]|uniref:Uncharacterized protein n=1 Tax=Nepenthes gracilis TaxID=150966 RepID=A0AAD3SPI2_NEPGR|nr:hypothetical protein Nepgr_015967 [Nepenthes gracilis]